MTHSPFEQVRAEPITRIDLELSVLKILVQGKANDARKNLIVIELLGP
jgi:hypothetical protein